MEPLITHYWLRCIGFRFTSTDADNQPHMVYMLDSRMETALEVSATTDGGRYWHVWLRSDLAHSRCRFCFVRTVSRPVELERLIEAIADASPRYVERDAEEFAESLEAERKECQRRYAEYCRHERWSRIPG